MSEPPRVPKTHQMFSDPPRPAEWVGRGSLLPLVEDAIQSVAWPQRDSPFSYQGQTFPANKLMTLEVYCYARGVYSSEEVEDLIHKDESLRDLFPDEWPAPGLVRRFRRSNRETILACLRDVFGKAFLVRFGEPDSALQPVDHCVALALDKWFEPICGPSAANEASERIDRAIFWDGMAMSDQGF